MAKEKDINCLGDELSLSKKTAKGRQDPNFHNGKLFAERGNGNMIPLEKENER